MNLEERLRGALKALDDLLDRPHDFYRRPDEERLRGKKEGIKLALSYLNEQGPFECCRHCDFDDNCYVTKHWCSCLDCLWRLVL